MVSALPSTQVSKRSQAFLLGGKRFASPLPSRGRDLASSPKDDPKGPSFADLLNSKGGRSSHRSLSAKRARQKTAAFAPPSPLTVGMAVVDSRPADSPTAGPAGPPPPSTEAAGALLGESADPPATTAGEGAPPPVGSEARASSVQRTLAYEEASAQAAQVCFRPAAQEGRWVKPRKQGRVLLTSLLCENPFCNVFYI